MATDLSMLKNAVRYPWADGQAGVTLVIGGILTLLSPLIVPGLLVLGYGLRVVEAVMDGQTSPPRFGDWGDLFTDGVKAGIVLLVVVVVPLFVSTIVLAAVLGAAGFRFAGLLSFRQGLASGGLTFVLFLLLAGLALVVLYLAPAALVHLARTRQLRSALDVDTIRELARSDAYGAMWLLALAVFAAAGIVVTVLDAAAFGVVVSGFVTFFAFVAMTYLYAHGAMESGFGLERSESMTTATDAEDEPIPGTDAG